MFRDSDRPRVLFVGRSRHRFPLAASLAKKWDAVGARLEIRVLTPGAGQPVDPRFRLLPSSAPAFYGRLPFEVARELRTFQPHVVIAADPYVGAGALVASRLAPCGAKVVVELHGDPRTFARLYGSPARRLVAPMTDAAARWALRNADATRALSRFTSSLIQEIRGLPADATFPTYSDLSLFADPPPTAVPPEQSLVFVGALEPYKNIDLLASVWRTVAGLLPDATLTIVGAGSRTHVVKQLLRDLPGRVIHHSELPPGELVGLLDSARALVLPSYPEGLGRVVLEAFARGRSVVATNGGGIPDIVTDDADGLLIPPNDKDALIRALSRMLSDLGLARRLGAAARITYADWHQTAEDFASRYGAFVDDVLRRYSATPHKALERAAVHDPA